MHPWGLVLSAVLLAAACYVSAAVHATPEKRVALVIGNGAYQHVAPLANPVNDSTDLAAALRDLGFEVVEGNDLDRSAFARKISEFARRSTGATTALLFYAGHGLQVNGRNYLVPIDAKLEHPSELDFQAVEVSRLLEQMQSEERVNLVFLDACRDNPLARSLARSMSSTRAAGMSPGLAKLEADRGTMIAYATSPNAVALDGTGRNSPFTTALLKHIRTPGWDLLRVMTEVTGDVEDLTNRKQSPWFHASLRRPVILKPAPEGAPGQAHPPAVTAAPDPCSNAAAHFRAAESLGSQAAFDDHVSRFPNCPFTGLARAKIASLKAEAAATAARHRQEQERRLAGEAGAECDRLAANPTDQRKPSEISGTPYAQLLSHARDAIAACEKAIKLTPAEPRYVYQLARAQQASDPRKAFGLYRRLEGLGYPAAFDNLGWMYVTGRGGEKSPDKAIKAFGRGADLGDPDAMVTLAKLFASGSGVPQSVERAEALYRRAAALNHPDAIATLQKLEEEAVRSAETRRNNEEAAKMFLQILGGIANRR